MSLSEEIRAQFSAGDMIRDAGLTTPEDIQRYDNIVYGEDEKWQLLDLYRPKKIDGKKKIPVIVSVHGGGWVYGDKECYQYYCMSLAQKGFAVVNFSYRLAPESKFPSVVIDMNLVFAWVLENARKYGLDMENLFAVGDSAGAHILGVYLNLCTNQKYADQFAKQWGVRALQNLKFHAVALNCGQYHFSIEDKEEELITRLVKELLPERGTEEELNSVNVDTHLTKEFPPVYLMTAEQDYLKDQAQILKKALEEKKISYQFVCYEGTEKELGHVFHLNMKSSDADRCNEAECEFFRHYI